MEFLHSMNKHLEIVSIELTQELNSSKNNNKRKEYLPPLLTKLALKNICWR